MEKLIVTVGSVTTAARLEKILKKTGNVTSKVIHTPASINKGGCSYSIITDKVNLPYVKEAVMEYGLNVKKYYIEEHWKGEKTYHVVS